MDNYKILHENKNFNIPIFIDSKIDEKNSYLNKLNNYIKNI
jgi:hypothetical protein